MRLMRDGPRCARSRLGSSSADHHASIPAARPVKRSVKFGDAIFMEVDPASPGDEGR